MPAIDFGDKRTLKTMTGGNSVVIPEDHIGTAQNEICYPAVSSCITITTLSPHGICGVHITYCTEDYLIHEMIAKMPPTTTVAFVVGAIDLFKKRTRFDGFNTRKKIASKMKKSLNVLGNVYFYDTLIHAKDVNVSAMRNGSSVNFGWAPMSRVNWLVVPDMSGYAAIPTNVFVRR